MESYGELLKKTREAKGLDLDTASYETTIALNYINALEAEDEAIFPGEPYMLGFMRTYAEYLGLSPDNVCNLYRAKKLQEAPTPEGLIVHEKPAYYWPLIIVLVLITISGGTFGTLYLLKKRAESKPVEEVVTDTSPTFSTYDIDDSAITKRVHVGDQFKFHMASGDIMLTVKNTIDSFGLDCPVGTLYTQLSEDAELDIDGDNIPDLIVYVSDVSSSDLDRGAEVRLLKASGGSASEAGEIETSASIAGNHKPVEVFKDNRAYPFTLNGNFRGSCLFRSKVDRKETSEKYFTTGEVITMTANNGIRLWMSNCNTVKLSVIADSRNYDLTIGKAGQVLCEDIKWIKDTTDGKYKLVLIELD